MTIETIKPNSSVSLSQLWKACISSSELPDSVSFLKWLQLFSLDWHASLGLWLLWVNICLVFVIGQTNLLQRSCLENPRDGGAWWVAVYGVAQSRTRLKQPSSSSSSIDQTLRIQRQQNKIVSYENLYWVGRNVNNSLQCDEYSMMSILSKEAQERVRLLNH